MAAETVKQVIEASIMLNVLAVGLEGSLSNLAYVFRHPGILFRAMLAVNVAVPLVAIALCLVFPIPPTTKAGIVIMAVSPLCPLALGAMVKAGADHDYAIGVFVALIFASIILVPVTVEILGMVLGRDFGVPISEVAALVATTVLLPLLVGLLFASFLPRLAGKAAPIASLLGKILLLPIVALILYRTGGEIVTLLGNGTLLVIALTILSGFVAGHFLGGPTPEYRLALAEAAATRHPAMAALIAGTIFGDRDIILAVLLFLFASLFLSALYRNWLKKRYFPAGAKAPAPAG